MLHVTFLFISRIPKRFWYDLGLISNLHFTFNLLHFLFYLIQCSYKILRRFQDDSKSGSSFIFFLIKKRTKKIKAIKGNYCVAFAFVATCLMLRIALSLIAHYFWCLSAYDSYVVLLFNFWVLHFKFNLLHLLILHYSKGSASSLLVKEFEEIHAILVVAQV